MTLNKLPQLALALEIGYSNQSSISRLLHDRDLPLDKAALLDDRFDTATLSWTFVERVEAKEAAEQQRSRRTDG